MIVLEKIRMSLPVLLYGFKVILIISGCFQMNMDGFRPIELVLVKF